MEIKINSMKTKLSLYIAIFTLIITGTVYAQEVTQSELMAEEILPERVIEVPVETEEVKEEVVQETQLFEVEMVSEENILIEDMYVSSTSSTATSSNSTPTLTDITILIPDDEDTVSLLIRNGADVLFEGQVILPEPGSITVADLEGDIHSIPSNSVLALLLQAEEEAFSFDVTKLNYYDSFGAFYLKCIQVEADELCENWQYVVNNVSPWTGIDQTIVSPGDTIGIYFGNPYQVFFSTSTYYTDTAFTATAQKYNYQENIWNARTGVTLGVTVSDPNNPWTPIEVMTSAVNSSGEALFTIATSGEYMIGVQEDYYYPSYAITVSSSTSTTTATSTDSSTGGGGSNKKTFDIPAAISFIKNLQASNGSYGGAELYSDWVAIAFGAHGTSDSALLNYLKTKSSIKSIITDNERRAMALLALGKDPYTYGGVNYIEAIIKDFDGTQFGEKELVNDDIFALIVLSEVGYGSGDTEIKKAIEFILKKQNSNGSWENSVDLTSASIQALIQFEDVAGVSSTISKAQSFLENQQESNGGWGNVYATSWGLQAMNALDESWKKNGNSPEDYLTAQQQSDGGVLSNSENEKDRIWGTSYAIPAVLGKSWNDILRSVSKPKEGVVENSGGGSNNSSATTTLVAMQEIIETEEVKEVATSTLIVASQTFETEVIQEVSELQIKKETKSEEISATTSTTSEESVVEEKKISWISTIKSMITKTISGWVAGLMEWF